MDEESCSSSQEGRSIIEILTSGRVLCCSRTIREMRGTRELDSGRDFGSLGWANSWVSRFFAGLLEEEEEECLGSVYWD